MNNSNNLRMSAELEVARRMQQMLLPKETELSQVEHLDIAGFLEPAEEVGDYYDVLEYEGCVKIGIADVTGHGLESGVLAIMIQAVIRALMTHQETDAIKFLTTLNRTIYDNVQRMDLDKQLTLTLLDYQPFGEGGQLRISGQHEDVIIIRENEVELIDTTELGFPIGVIGDIGKYVGKAELNLNPDDVVALYTDGITEAFNFEHEQYGLERLCQVIQQNRLLPAQDIRQAVIADVRSYMDLQTVLDDITLLIVKQK